jgi:hypothetical protein
MALGAVVARILTQYSDKGSKAASKDIMKLGKSFDKFSKRSAKAFGIAAAASAAFAVKIGTDAVQAAIADQKSQALLATSLRNTVGATDSAIAGTENYITSLQKQFSVVDDDLRPAMARLTAATGSITAAQSLMDTALNVSASSGADLATSVGAIIKATSGQFKALKTLVPSLTAATIKSKDFGKALEEVNKATSGAAATRAGTLEYRLAGLRIAFGEILETLGYALLPVMERFATTISTKVLPQLEAFISANKDRLAASFQVATDFAIKLLNAAIAFGDWVSNNTTKVKVLAGLIAGMFVGVGIANFIILLASVTAAMATLAATATGAAIASAYATGGATVLLATGAVGAIIATMNAYNQVKGGSTPNASGTSKQQVTNGYLGSMPVGSAVATNNPVLASVISGPGSDLQKFLASLGKTMTTTAKATKDLLTEKQKELNAKLKELGIATTEQQDAITQNAILRNLKREKDIREGLLPSVQPTIVEELNKPKIDVVPKLDFGGNLIGTIVEKFTPPAFLKEPTTVVGPFAPVTPMAPVAPVLNFTVKVGEQDVAAVITQEQTNQSLSGSFVNVNRLGRFANVPVAI